MAAHGNWNSETVEIHGSDPGDWLADDGSALVDSDITDGSDSTYAKCSTTGKALWLKAEVFSRSMYRWEIVRFRFRAKRSASGTAYIHLNDGGAVRTEANTADLTTSWEWYTIACFVGTDTETGTSIDNQFTFDSGDSFQPRCILTGGAEMHIAKVEIDTYVVADLGYLSPNADGTMDFTLSAGSNAWDLLNTFTGVESSDWNAGNKGSVGTNISTATQNDVAVLEFETPGNTNVGVDDVVWCLWFNQTSSGSGEWVTVELLENGTEIGTPMHANGAVRGSNFWSHNVTDNRYHIEVFVIHTEPTDWADVEIKTTYDNGGGQTIEIQSMAMLGPWEYAPSVTYEETVSETGEATATMAVRIIHKQAVIDAAEGIDNISQRLRLPVSVSDIGQASDTKQPVVTHKLSLLEDGLGSDTLTVRQRIVIIINEVANNIDNVTGGERLQQAVTEIAEATDTASAVLKIVQEVAEHAVATEDYSVFHRMRNAVEDHAEATDQLTALLKIIKTVDETAVASDSIALRLKQSISFSEVAVASDSWLVRVYSQAKMGTAISAIARVLPLVGADTDIKPRIDTQSTVIPRIQADPDVF